MTPRAQAPADAPARTGTPALAQAGRAATALGTALAERGEHAAAERMLRRAVRCCTAAYGPDDPRLAVPLRALGAVCAARGRLAEAEALLNRVLVLVAGPPDGTEEES
ncbi:tetratricopeptide repeat protein [Kitasatospora sp. DSM 101779]|uniref:tetratricopeptide repeat protein n=1 Tax=Kitasatospora sp. DSM 101779 TaxID=2853165 RepID=UPI0021D85670|nr:tetratricopeptide repeat protein [Kitasatospora sp. DSM 101779]MCU7821239.1 tetratricopeptide repeat protein [Kitasatospora sp. DSM 101779]